MHVLYLPSAHTSIVENMKLLHEEGIAIEELPIRDARVDCEALAKMLRKETVLVSMDAVCGETGVIWNTRDVKQTMGADIFLHVDASQAPLTEKITRAHFGADLLTLDGSKVGDVRGIGALIARSTIPMSPLYRGGGQERGLRAGSESPELAQKFAAMLSVTTQGRVAFRARAGAMREKLTADIAAMIPDVHVTESDAQAPHILNLSLPGRDTDYLVALLDEAGLAVSTRSACETDSVAGSRAVLALTGDRARALATLRISWGPQTRAASLARFVSALARSVAFVDKSNRR
uniref:Cysteine desulfurase DndA n=1 Tax=uncultured bacterium CSLC2 TaxID=1091571 RepID=G4WVS0_9BACT|nr:cysteine desulfurase DndA [uncultured bacterium CSLC2]